MVVAAAVKEAEKHVVPTIMVRKMPMIGIIVVEVGHENVVRVVSEPQQPYDGMLAVDSDRGHSVEKAVPIGGSYDTRRALIARAVASRRLATGRALLDAGVLVGITEVLPRTFRAIMMRKAITHQLLQMRPKKLLLRWEGLETMLTMMKCPSKGEMATKMEMTQQPIKSHVQTMKAAARKMLHHVGEKAPAEKPRGENTNREEAIVPVVVAIVAIATTDLHDAAVTIIGIIVKGAMIARASKMSHRHVEPLGSIIRIHTEISIVHRSEGIDALLALEIVGAITRNGENVPLENRQIVRRDVARRIETKKAKNSELMEIETRRPKK